MYLLFLEIVTAMITGFLLTNSVCNHTRDWQIGLLLHVHPILLITHMITDRIGLHSVLLPLLITFWLHRHTATLNLFVHWFLEHTSQLKNYKSSLRFLFNIFLFVFIITNLIFISKSFWFLVLNTKRQKPSPNVQLQKRDNKPESNI